MAHLQRGRVDKRCTRRQDTHHGVPGNEVIGPHAIDGQNRGIGVNIR